MRIRLDVLLPFLTLSICAALSTTSQAAADPVFKESNGLVVIEAESVPLGTNWELLTGSASIIDTETVSGASGNACLIYKGGTEDGSDIGGELVYKIDISKKGTYKLLIRAMPGRMEMMDRTDVANDCFVMMEGQTASCYGFYSKNVIKGGVRYDWSWDTKMECSHHVFSVAQYSLDVGLHTFKVAGRSKNYIIDRIVLAPPSYNVYSPLMDLPLSEIVGGATSVTSSQIRPRSLGSARPLDMFTIDGKKISLSSSANRFSPRSIVLVRGSDGVVRKMSLHDARESFRSVE